MSDGSNKYNPSSPRDNDSDVGSPCLVRADAVASSQGHMFIGEEEAVGLLSERFDPEDECNGWGTGRKGIRPFDEREEVCVPDLGSYFEGFPDVDIEGRINICRTYASHLSASIRSVKKRKV